MASFIPSQRELTFSPATRLQDSLVSGSEKRALIWMARRTPACINSDHLTVLGFLSQCMAGVCYALAKLNPDFLLAGIVCLALNWFGDSLDGTLARVRNQQRPRYGFYVDHIADTVAAFFLMGGMALSGYVHPAIAMGMLVAFLMLSIETYLATYTLGQFQLSYWVFGPTEIRILLAIGNLALLWHPVITLAGHRVRLFDLGGLIAILGMGLMLMISAITHTCRLYREERIPQAGSSGVAE
ncbi:MAG TPA: CDP-alcohol phosphatidyltransferase family protein [Terriglobales bacterium]|nr:CDP-alcohol phosphatidyltransferase family protein [Terriglobales bacterium]